MTEAGRLIAQLLGTSIALCATAFVVMWVVEQNRRHGK